MIGLRAACARRKSRTMSQAMPGSAKRWATDRARITNVATSVAPTISSASVTQRARAAPDERHAASSAPARPGSAGSRMAPRMARSCAQIGRPSMTLRYQRR